MKIALLGYGKMGKLIERAAQAKGHEIVCRFTSSPADWNEISNADICIDFSHAGVVIENLTQCALRGKNVVIGTTGWEEHLEEAKSIADSHGIGVLYGPNFSLGVHLFLQILDFSAQLMNRFKEYDVAGLEMHHAQKKDAPSGTALEMCRRLEKSIERVQQLDMTAVRVGSIPGTHTVMFDSAFDTITITHQARNREGFAGGAVEAAQWLLEKKGFYTLDDYLNGVSYAT